jgi:phage replication O-like protein O
VPAHNRSGTPQLENGYTKLADELLEALCRAHLGGREMAVALAVIRLTYGWQKKKDRIAASQIAKLTAIPRPKIPSLLRALEAKGIVRIEKSGQGRIPTLSIKKDHRKWSKRGRRTSPRKGASSSNQLAPLLGSTSPPQGGGTSPRKGAYHREINNTTERGVRFGRLKPRLSGNKVAALIAIRPGGALYSTDEVQAWFLATEPIMLAKGYKSTARCAVNWFRRVKPEEIRKAVSWVEAQAVEGLGTEDNREKDTLSEFAKAFSL